jgi:hypothetical protein
MKILFLGIVFFCFACMVSFAQDLYSINSLNINTRDYVESAAYPYKDGIVFVSNRIQSSFVIRVDTSGQPLFDLYFARKKDNKKFAAPDFFSKDVKTKAQEGAATFSSDGKTIYFTRVEDNKYTAIYSATNNGSGWVDEIPFQYNIRNYFFDNPCLSDDGRRLFFTSNRPGGQGGHDIWVCTQSRSGWGAPKNLGAVINSPSDEYFPFFHKNGKLYFTSNRPGGSGGKDIYWSKEINGQWLPVQRLPAPMNTRFDDYAYVSDSADRTGYISSNRAKSADIFSFLFNVPVFKDPKPIIKNTYSYTFRESSIVNDTSTFLYEWDFGDGTKVRGRSLVVKHKFKGPGDYLVQLNVIDSLTNELYLNQASNVLPVRDEEQPVITCSDTVYVREQFYCDANKTYLPDKKIMDYFWDFGDGTLMRGKEVKHDYYFPGKYRILLGVTVKKGDEEVPDAISVFKDIVVLDEKNTPE